MNAYLLGQQVPEVWNFGLFTIAKVGYQAQVIPALLAGLALGFIETRLKRIVPDYLYLVIVPVCSADPSRCSSRTPLSVRSAA